MRTSLSQSPIVILGGSGFIGSRLATLLSKGSQPVRIADLRKSDVLPDAWIPCDVRSLQPLSEAVQGAETIINLAAEHRDDIRPLSRYREVNVDGAINVCEAARRAGVRQIIFTSSVAVYGFHPRAIDEAGPFEPFNEYGRTKLEAERIYQDWLAEDSSRSLVIVRPTVVFGEGNRGNVYNLLRQIASGNFLMVGSGENFKSMCYVGNVAAFLAHSLTLGSGLHISNYVDQPDMNTRHLVDHIHTCLGRSGRVRQIPKPIAFAAAHVLDLFAQISGRNFPVSAIRVRKFCETTRFKSERIAQWGFSAPFTLAEGLALTVKFEFDKRAQI